MRLPRILLVLFLLSLATGVVFPGKPAAASSPATNIISNPGFENGVDSQGLPLSWSFQTCEGVANATASVDTSMRTDGADSAKVASGPLTPTGCYGADYSGRAVGFSQFRQFVHGPGLGYNFTQLTDDPAGFSFWFQLQPLNGNGMAGFEVRLFGAESLSELDYVFNPDPSIGQFQNNTNTHSLIFNGYQYGQWYHFSRNLRTDWLTPMGPAHTPLNLNYNFTLLQFQGFASKSGSTIRSETFWIDGVQLYVGQGPIPGTTSNAAQLQIVSPTYGANITDLSLSVGSTFTVNVVTTNAGNLSAFDITLLYGTTNYLTTPITTNSAAITLSPGLFDGTNLPGQCQPFVLKKDAVGAPLNFVRVAAVIVGGCQVPGDGTLFSVTFTVSDIGATSLDIRQASGGRKEMLLVGGPANDAVPNIEVTGALFRNKSGIPPTARFTFSPLLPFIGNSIGFNGTASYDPDSQTSPGKGIKSFIWDFGDAAPGIVGTPSNASSVQHVFLIVYPTVFGSGYFSVRLWVIDSDNGLPAVQTQVVYISPGVVHNIGVAVSLSKSVLTQGDPLTVTVTVGNQGNTAENANLTVIYDFQGNTTLARESIIQLSPGASSNFNYALATGALPPRVYTVTAFAVIVNATSSTIVTDSNPLDNVATVSFSLQPLITDIPPVANFTYSPGNPVAGSFVQFDGSGSRDADGFVSSFNWLFGDGTFGFGSFVGHTFSSAGSYTVTLTVQDNVGLQASTSQVVIVRPRPAHDVGITSVGASPRVVVSGQIVSIGVGIANYGNSSETIDITAYYGSHVAGSLSKITAFPFFSFYNVQWDTTGVQPGNYTISATVFLASDENLANNNMTDGIVTVLPPPVLSVSPGSGSPGTTVTVHGSGFPSPEYGPSSSEILVTFDDMLTGFAFTHAGAFNFTFSVPLSQPGAHRIKALDVYSSASAYTSFLVVATPVLSRLDVAVTGGTIYFPGDTAVFYVLAGVSGQPVSAGLQVILVRPSGPNVSLSPVLVGPGRWKVTFSVPSTGSIGTYVVVVKAHLNGSGDGVALSGFEVKPTWLQGHASTVVGVAAVFFGVTGVLAVAWRKGVFRRQKEDLLFP